MATDTEPQAVQRKGDKEEQKKKVRGMFARKQKKQDEAMAPELARREREELGVSGGELESQSDKEQARKQKKQARKMAPELARRAGEEEEEDERLKIEGLKAKGEALQAQAEQDKIDADLAELAENPPEPPEAKAPEAKAPEAPADVPDEPTEAEAEAEAEAKAEAKAPEAKAPVSEDRLGESPVERYPGESADRERNQAVDKALAADSASAEDTLAMRKGGFEDVPEDFTPRNTVKTLRAESPTQEMAREVGQPGPVGGGGRIKQVEEISADDPRARLGESTLGILEGMDPEEDDSLSVGKEEAAERAIKKDQDKQFMEKESKWQGRGGYNFTYRPPATKDGQPSILVEAPIGRKGSSMKEGTKAVVTADSKIFAEILGERLGKDKGKYVTEHGKHWSGGPSKSPDPKDPPKDKWVTNADGTKDYYDEDGMLMVDGSKKPRKDTQPPDTNAEWKEKYQRPSTGYRLPNGKNIRLQGDYDPVYVSEAYTDLQAQLDDREPTAEEIERRVEARVALYKRTPGGSSEGEVGGEVQQVAPLRDSYEGGDPTADEIKDAVSEISPSVKSSRQIYALRRAKQNVQQAETGVQQAMANLERAQQITESTGDTTAQIKAENILNREKAALAAAIKGLSQSRIHVEPSTFVGGGPVDADAVERYTSVPGKSAPWGPK